MAYIEISGISKSFVSAGARREVLATTSLSVERGEFVSIVGMMGCGKSTFLKIVAGLIPPDRGRVEVNGSLVRGIQPNAAIVFQNYSLLPWFSALENVRLAVGAAFPDWPKERQREQAVRHLEAVGLGNSLQRRPGQLSGGMRQRVAIARAFAIEPEILFLDEPFGALDALTRESLQQELIRLASAADRPVTAVMITNSVEEALLLSDRIVPMTRGSQAILGQAKDHPGRSRGATLGTPVPVELRRPRTASELIHDDDAAHVRAHVIASLTEDLERSRSRAAEQSAQSRGRLAPQQMPPIAAEAESEG